MPVGSPVSDSAFESGKVCIFEVLAKKASDNMKEDFT